MSRKRGLSRDLFGHPVHERGVRTGGDSYYTPGPLARALVRLLPIVRGDSCLEGHAGGGAFCQALVRSGALVHAQDVDPRAPALRGSKPWTTSVGNFITEAAPCSPLWVVGNPPYASPGDRITCSKCKGGGCKRCEDTGKVTPMVPAAEKHIRRALEVTGRHVAFLLRLGILSSQGRAPLWKAHPPRVVWVLSRRPSFTGGGTDQYDYAWVWWDAEHDGETTIGWV